MRCNKRFILCIIFFLGAFWPSDQKAVFAGSFHIIDNLDFGVIAASSDGGSMVLSKDELENPTEPYKGLLRISGGTIGKVRYVPESEEEYIFSIIYPNDYYLDEDNNVCLRYMHQYSTLEVPKEDARPYFDIEIGGELHVPPGYRGTVLRNVPINIIIHYD